MSELSATLQKELELFLLEMRYREGRLTLAEGNRTFLLDDAQAAWIVYTGQIDVFAVSVKDGEAAGTRRHVFRAEVGCVLLGMALPANGLGLLAVGTPGSQVVRLSLARLRELSQDLEHGTVVAAHLDAWVLGVSRGIAGAIAPKESVLLVPNCTYELNARQAAAPGRGVVWVRPAQDTVALIGLPQLKLPSGGFSPLTRATWLRTSAPTNMETLGTVEYLTSAQEWSWLVTFHRLVLMLLTLSGKVNTNAEMTHLRNHLASEQIAVDGAVNRLAALLAPASADNIPAPDGDLTNPLLTACRWVGAALKINIRAAPTTLAAETDPAGRVNSATDSDSQSSDGLSTAGADAFSETPPAPPTPAAALNAIAQASQMRVRQVALKGEWWRSDHGPLLAFVESNVRPVALLPIGSRRYELRDPVELTRRPLTPQTAAMLSPFAFMFYPPFPNRALNAWDLLTFGSKGLASDRTTVLGAGLAMGLLALLTPLATGYLFDTVVPSADRGQLVMIGGALVLSALAAATFQIARNIALLRIEGKLTTLAEAAVWDRLLNLPPTFFRAYSAGDLGARAMGINTIRRTLAGTALSTILTAFFSVFTLLLLFSYGLQLALTGVALIAVSVAATLFSGIASLRYQRKLVEQQGKISGTVLQLINGIAKFRIAGAEGRAFALWAGHFAEQKQLAFKARIVRNGLAVFNAAYPILTTMIIFAMLGLAGRAGLSTGQFLGFNAAFGQLVATGLALSSTLIGLMAMAPVYERAKPILRALPEVDTAKHPPGELRGEIEINHVSFRYREHSPLILRDVSLHINPGEFVALVGASGSGKSTLFRLLLGFESPESGAILYDGQELTALDVRAVRQQLGVVTQSARLLTGDIFANIVGTSQLTVDDAWEAARLCGLDEDIKQMPMGMHTLISEGGGTFSGGQRQRLLIARAIVRRPRILLFDEATSALDNRTQEIVSHSLANLKATRVVIAHRLSTIQNADRIYVLNEGHIVQSGTYAELIDRPGLFADLAKRQMV